MGRRLNTSTPTVIQTELVPLDENFAIEANGTLEQWYYENNSQYAPDRSITPLILSPKIMVADKDTQQSWDDAHVTKSVVAWSVMESNTWVDITSSSVLSDYELSGNNLIVHKNVSYSQGVTIMCKLTYVDPRDNGIYITTQDTVLLTCNRDANVVLPEVAITSPSARSFNPLVDGASTEYDFDAVVTNSPDVEMQSSDIATYEMDGSGTEEIISDANGIAPILDIRYPDSETQTDQEFVYRQTANGEKPDEVGAAFISKIKGNTVAWNQITTPNYVPRVAAYIQTSIDGTRCIVTNIGYDGDAGDTTAVHNYTALYTIPYHKYICLVNSGITQGEGLNVPTFEIGGSSTTSTSLGGNQYGGILNPSRERNVLLLKYNGTTQIGDSWWFDKPMLIDLTLMFGEGNEPSTVEEFESWLATNVGLQSYYPYNAGELIPVKMNGIKTVGFNLWDGEWSSEQKNYLTETGELAGTTVTLRVSSFIKVLPSSTIYLNGIGGNLASCCFYDINKNFIIGERNYSATSKTLNAPQNAYYLKASFDYSLQPIVNLSNPSKNGTYEPYEEHIASVPVTSATGRLLDASGNPTGSTVTIFPDGLKKVNNIQDEIFAENGVVKAIKRVGSVDMGSLTWEVNTSQNWFQSQILTNPATYQATQRQDIISAKYIAVSDYSIRLDQPDKAMTIGRLGASYERRAVVRDSDFTDAATFKTAMNGVMLYYKLATPETYVLDPVQNPFIYKWFGIDANNNEVLAETLPWYVSGQDTSKLRVDAMWGEKINVVLRAMMPTGALSPSKAYAALTWRIPDVDTTVVSYNGSAVRSDTNSMTFGTIVNINGRNLEDSVKAANLRFKWVYRKNFTSQETVAGWSQGESDQITIQASNLRSVRAQDSTLASTLVFPYVYCLGAWTTNQGTETGYSKPTTTKNGVTYYRIVD